jgi:hypothetical protein
MRSAGDWRTLHTETEQGFRELQSVEDYRYLSPELRVLDRYELAATLSATLEKLGPKMAKLAKRVNACHRSFNQYQCDVGHRWAVAFYSCSCRLCPHDQRQRSRRLAHKWANVLRDDWLKLRHLVLAERNCAVNELEAGIAHLWESWQRFRQMECWEDTRGCIVALEVTYNAEEETWHPHLHILFLGKFIPFVEVNTAWVEATEAQGQTSHISAIKSAKYERLGSPERTVQEIIKYVTKTADFVDIPKAVGAFLDATHKRRFLRTYGCYYRLKIEDAEVSALHCPDCDSKQVVKLGRIDASMVGLDSEGAFRVRVPVIPDSCLAPVLWRGADG